MSDDTCWESQPRAGWDEYTRARERFFAQAARSQRPAQNHTPDDDHTWAASHPPAATKEQPAPLR